MTRFAILISVEDYASCSPTPFAHADARLLAETLVESCDYAVQHILEMPLMPDQGHTPSNILEQVKGLASRLKPGDTLVFFFAGHGHLKDGETFLVLPNSTLDAIDSTGLPLRDLTDELRVKECGCFRILDACHSGLDVRAEEGLDPQGFVSMVVRGQPSGWVTLAACTETEYSVSDSEIGNGVFTHYLCKEIREMNEGSEVLPELLKVNISPKVTEHAARIGNKQTPTLIAALSGNVALAVRTRRSDPPPLENAPATQPTLMERIVALRAVEDILVPKNLEGLLASLASEVERAVRSDPFFEGEVTRTEEMGAESIPEYMHGTIVEFTRGQGLNTQHNHSRVEERVQNPLDLGYLIGTKQRAVDYGVSQAHSLPPSALVLQAEGDGRCVPGLSILVYVIPLQISCCLLVSGFRRNWTKRVGSATSVFSGFKVLHPGDSEDEVKKLANFAVTKIRERTEEHVAKRVEQLENELAADE